MQGLDESGRTGDAEAILAQLRGSCEERSFAPADLLRRKGAHHHDMFLIEEGEAAVERGEAAGTSIIVGAGAPIGEMGFIHGAPATASVSARTPIRALVLDDATLARIEAGQPDLAVRLLHWLAGVADSRTSQNLALAEEFGSFRDSTDIQVVLCRSDDMLVQAQKLRFDVYCGELGRTSPYADESRGVLADQLDEFGDCFLAMCGEEVVGTLRLNRAVKGSLGILANLYGMQQSPHHPAGTGVCTKFIVKRAHRRGPSAMKLVAAVVRYGHGHGVDECYIDCVPGLIHYYRAMGFKLTGEKFFHVENGPSFPMKLDVVKYGARLTRELGISRMLAIYARSRMIKLADRLLGRTKNYQ